MTVPVIGVGPGSADLLTIRGMRLIKQSPIFLYAGSLVSKKILNFCPKNAIKKNTAYMNLDKIFHEFKLLSLPTIIKVLRSGTIFLVSMNTQMWTYQPEYQFFL